MNNIQLELEFEKIFAISNAFDAFLALNNLKSQYKKSTFYKKTKMPILQAYSVFKEGKINKALNLISNITDVEYISNLLTDYLNGIDSDTMNHFIDKIINAFNLEQIEDLKGDLTQAIDLFKK